jgi:drug/metabolite transporter (DMT)-like permease
MSTKQVSNKLLVLGMVASMFLWGLSWPSAKMVTGFSSAINFSLYRFILVAVTMAIMLPIMGIRPVMSRRGLPAVLVAGALMAVYGYFFFMGLKKGAAGFGGVLVTTLNPIFSYTIGIVLSRKRPTPNEFIGLALGLVAGTILLRLWGNLHALVDSGNLYFLGASFSWALMSKFTSRGAAYGNPLAFSLWHYAATVMFLLPLADYHEWAAVVLIKDPVFWGNLVFSAVIVTCIATTIFFYTTTRLGAEKASSFIFLVPLAAALSSWLLLGEVVQSHTIAGGLVGIVAVYFINRKPSKTLT